MNRIPTLRTRPRRIFFDMDGVLVDFDRYRRENDLTADQVKQRPHAYRDMLPIESAIEGIRRVIDMASRYGFEVWLATKPPTGIPWAYADKAYWILENLPELERRIIMTHDKGLLGDSDDVLVDDMPHRANCFAFKGALVHFGPTGNVPNWFSLVDRLSRMMKSPLGAREANAIEDDAPLEDVNEARRLMRLGDVMPVPRSILETSNDLAAAGDLP